MNPTTSRAKEFAVGFFLGAVAVFSVALVVALVNGWVL